MSLADLGYNRIGIDDGWQSPSTRYLHKLPDGHWKWSVNERSFPDLVGLTSRAHAHSLFVEFYLDNCIMPQSWIRTVASEEREAIEPTAVFAQDLRRRVGTNGVMDEMDLSRTEITGNQELPKVLYIVPWQNSDPGEMTGRPVNTLIDEVLAPIDRSEFIRQVDYYGDLSDRQE